MEKFYTILLLVFYALLFSCSEEDKTIVDYRCKVDVSNVQTEKVYANLPIPLNLSIIGNDEQIGEYEVCYTGLEGKGDILVDNLKLPEKEFVHFGENQLLIFPSR